MNPLESALYALLTASGIMVQVNVADPKLWRLTDNAQPLKMKDLPLTKADMLMVCRCCLQILTQVSKDPFIDIDVSGIQQAHDELIVHVRM